jgi:hypothetical protein
MPAPHRIAPRDDRGAVLMMVLAFAIVVTIGGLAFLESGSPEQAFWLAEGAYERATAELWNDASWGSGTPKTMTDTLSGGNYYITVRDTTISGNPGYRFFVWGTVQGVADNSQRRVDVATTVKLAAWDDEYSVIAGGEVDIQSAAAYDNLGGNVHADSLIDVPPSRAQKSTWTDGVVLSPPPMYTEPDSFGLASGTTYYYIKCIGTGPITCEVLDRNGAPFAPAKYFNPSTAVTYSGGKYSFTLTGGDLDWGSSVLTTMGSATRVVANFGYYQTSDISFDGGGADIKSTIISTKYAGPSSPASARLVPANWTGGTVTLNNNARFVPVNGIALVVKDLIKAAGGLGTYVGTSTSGAVVYATGDISGTGGAVTFNGALIALGNVSIGGGTTIVYKSSFYSKLPGPFQSIKAPGASAAVTMVNWKEIPRL